ncbi:MAG: DMT family protein [Candidatus Eremiobacteraeota bacterium]|nr:DMT family protein [Candidatus Eremiobacteraeota bacterium]
MLAAILLSWGIAFFEYLFQVPANRIGYGRFNLVQLKVIQECVTLCVFTCYAFIVFQQRLQWNHVVAYLLIVAAVFFAFRF